MDYHQNARLTVRGREQMCRQVVEQVSAKTAAKWVGRYRLRGREQMCRQVVEQVSAKTAAKWVGRYRELGGEGLGDRSSRPRRLRQPTSAQLVARVESLRRERWTGLRIAQTTGLSRATVSRILRRLKLNRMRDLDPPVAIQR